jgi:hypothetical protein
MLKELWEKIKKANREPKPIQYAKDKNGKEIKFSITPSTGRKITKHEASKRGYKPVENYKQEKKHSAILSNHERVIAGRAAKMNISVAKYKATFCNK